MIRLRILVLALVLLSAAVGWLVAERPSTAQLSSKPLTQEHHSRSVASGTGAEVATRSDVFETYDTGDEAASVPISDSDILPLLEDHLDDASGEETQAVLDAIAEFARPPE